MFGRENYQWHRKVHLSVQSGVTIKQLSKILKSSEGEISDSYYLNFTYFDKQLGTIGMGFKNEPYFTETEMINGYDVNKVQMSKTELDLWKN
jgi:hypothetical protein